MKPNRSLIAYLGSRLGIFTVSILGAAGIANAQTWTNTTSGTSNWSTATNWDSDPAVPVSDAATAVKFFATPGIVIPAASVIGANQDIATPMILNSLTVNGTGPGSGTAPSLTISGGSIRFAGTSPVLNVNAGYGSVGYTVNINSNLDFNTDTAINFSNGGASINVGGVVTLAGAGKVTFTGALDNRPLSLSKSSGTNFTGDVVVADGVLQLNKDHNILGTNAATTQSVTVASGSGVNLAYGDAAYGHPQNFVISGNGNGNTTNAVINATGANYGNGSIGGLALAGDSTVRMTMTNAGDVRFVYVTRGIVGSGKLIKMGNGYLQPSVASPASVTWGGTLFTSYTGNVEIKEGVIQTPGESNAFGPNAATTQRVTVSSGASAVINAGENAWTQPQNFILNGSGTGYAANNGGFAALDSPSAAYGSNTVRRIVVATDSTISARRNGASSGLGKGLTTTVGLSGAGNLTINGPYGTAISPVYLSQAASEFEEFPAFSGKVIINNGIVNIGHADALGSSPTGQITLNGLGAVSSSLGLNQTFLTRIENLATTSGAVCLGNASNNNLDFSSAPNLRLGSIGNYTYGGTLTPAGGIYRLGGGGGTLTVSSLLTGTGNSVVISGSVILSNAANDLTGGITLAGNNSGLGQTAILNHTGGVGTLNGNAITFDGAGGTYAYTGAAAGSSDSVGALAFTSGHSNVTSTKGAAGNTSLTFSSMTARSAGATGNFTVSGGTNGTDNKITVTGLATGFVDKGVFFGDFNYAYNAAGFLRAPVYGTDSGFVTSGATSSVASAVHQSISGALSAQNTATFITFKIAGNYNIALATDQVMTVDGILKSGSGAGAISGAGALAGIKASSGSEMVIRPYSSNDNLTISTPILDNGTSSLTKTGAGTLTLTAANTYTGMTTVVAGTLMVSGSGRLEDTSSVTVNGGTYNVSVNDTVGAVTLKNGLIGGASTLTGASYAVENGSISPILAGSAVLTKSSSGQVILTGVNTYNGGTSITGGTLSVLGTGRLADSGTIAISGGGAYEVGSADTVGGVTLTDGIIRGAGALNATSYTVEKGTISAPLAGTGTITKNTAETVTLAGANTAVSNILVNEGTLVLADNAKLNFVISGTNTTNSVVGAGTVTLDGEFAIDLISGSPDLTTGSEWLLVDVNNLIESYGTTFSVAGFTAKPDGVTWTKMAGTKMWTFSEPTGKLTIGPAGYASWESDKGVIEGENGDDDKDGIINLVEYALGLDPKASSHPAGSYIGTTLTFVKGPEAKAAGDVSYTIETSTTLEAGSWTPVGATVTPDDISYTLPAAQGRIFGRLKVTRP